MISLSHFALLLVVGIAEYTVKNLQFALSVEPKNADDAFRSFR